MDPLLFVAAAVLGCTVGAFVASLAARAKSSARESELSTRLAEREREVAQAREQITRGEQNASELRAQLARESQARAALEQALKDEQARLSEQRGLLDEARTKLEDTFKALAADTLRTQSHDFLRLAKEQLGALHGAGAQELEARKREIDLLVQPLHQQLHNLSEQAQRLERERHAQQGALDEQLRALERETKTLSLALRQPHVRGKWGELTLRRVVELAGMSERCDFEEQVTVAGEDGRLRPDLIVHLPNHRDLVVDAKTSLLLSYTEACEAETEEARAEALRKHAQIVRAHVHKLAAKQYWDQFERAPEFVVLFLYNEAAFGAAVTADSELFEYALNNKVVIATPTTLIALLRAVAYGWRQEQLTQTARQISDLGKQLFDRMATFADHMRNLGKRLDATVEDYNRAVGSLESRVLPGARRFKELGVVGDDREIESLEKIDQTPRALEGTGQLFDDENCG